MTQSNFDIILYGGPGAGKGTQAKALVGRLDAAYLEMGGQIREFIKGESEEARQARAIVERGKLVPLFITKAITNDFLNGVPHHKRIVFDGYPRSMEQAQNLEELLKEHNRSVTMIYIEIPDDVSVERLAKRAEVEHRVDDLDREAVRNRLEVFHDEAKDLLLHYDQQNRLFTVNGNQSKEEVADNIAKLVE